MKAVGWVRVGVDCVLLGAATAIAVSPLATVYDGSAWVRAAALGLLAAIGVTLEARAVRVGALLTTLLLVVAYLVVAPAAAAPDRAVAGVLPGVDSLQTVLKGVVQSWRTVVTQPVPLGSTNGELVVPFVIALAGPFLATTLLWRSRWSGLAAVPVAAMFAAAAAFGTRVTETPMLRGLLLVVLLTAWLRLRNAHGASSFWLRRIGMSAALLAVAGAIGWGAAAAVRQGGREVLRDHVDPPLAELDFKSPLSRYRDFYKSHGDEVLFTFRDLPEDTRLIRLATMDSFDGYVWNVSTTELLSGSSAFRTAPPTSGARTTHVTVGDYSGPWIPTVGRATAATLTHDGADGAERELLLNTATGTVAQFGDGRSKDEYDIAWEPTNEGDEVEASAVDRSYPLSEMNVPTIEKLDTLARGWISTTDADTDYERARALVKGFRDNGYFNDGLDEKEFGVSASGHGLKRLADMVSDEKRIVGNDEQYASAMAYVAQRMGMPARVVIGFDQMEDGSVTGNDIA
ncbi:MAG: transglutaminase domain-containing protein, partial [Myxococcaceae bacterium]